MLSTCCSTDALFLLKDQAEGDYVMKWQYWGQVRPDFADEPGTGQESVWDYPRPPCWEYLQAEVTVRVHPECIIQSKQAIRVLETAGPPTVYLPPTTKLMAALRAVDEQSWCEWKGIARYWALAAPWQYFSGRDEVIAWSYPEPTDEWQVLKDYVSFYPGRVPCFIDGERVRAQEGYFYGGWVTDKIVGPWKGKPGTSSW